MEPPTIYWNGECCEPSKVLLGRNCVLDRVSPWGFSWLSPWDDFAGSGSFHPVPRRLFHFLLAEFQKLVLPPGILSVSSTKVTFICGFIWVREGGRNLRFLSIQNYLEASQYCLNRCKRQVMGCFFPHLREPMKDHFRQKIAFGFCLCSIDFAGFPPSPSPASPVLTGAHNGTTELCAYPLSIKFLLWACKAFPASYYSNKGLKQYVSQEGLYISELRTEEERV